MSIYKLQRSQLIKRCQTEIFDFFKSPENLIKITPSNVGFNILTPRPIKMHTGTVLDYTINILGFKVRWTTLITEYDEPNRFADVSIKGPYSFWYHKHTFVKTDEGTTMNDEVIYALPYGFLGRLVHSIWVKKQLNYIFDFRAKIIEEEFGEDINNSVSQEE
jgi:ligand-binding SRPBCC domain-containing protein